jgi:NAD(P)-dependent dehydrogenase (short-subunit alcohol dehydrogenase family)
MSPTALRLAGKVAIITGGGSGIGRAASLLFAQAGCRVVVVDWKEEGGRETERVLEAEGGEGTFIRADVSDGAAVEALVAKTMALYGRLDALYSNAAVVRGYGGPVEATEADWDATMAVNVKGAYLCAKHAIPAMIASGGGSVINQSSVAAIQGGGPPLSGPCAAYTTSKAAILGLTRSIAYSYGHKNIRANSILPGLTDTGMVASLLENDDFRQAMVDSTPLHRIGTPEDVGWVALFLASDESSFVSGAEILVDGACWLSQGITYPEPLLFEDPEAGKQGS